MSVITRLRDFFHDSLPVDDSAETDERLTVAVLLILIARADGRTLKVEEEGLRVLLGSRFGLTREQAERLLRHAAEIEGTLEPSTSLIDRIAQDVPSEDRPRLLALAYRIAAIDGAVHEFEDDLIWRTGRLLDLPEAEIAAIKEEALRNLVPDQARG
ncbi:TerB family tellurite resistance protein [Microvirga subterranea]|uniref:Putative tellurite resistance protein B-like protein n=1 Tax=Microvirga subterranea TaxID=186651 RepID=A0A370HUS3_9HYPH|nr:TerB family tellurite resistance protein [Microvirga subterranea]RDI62070.1 putative tellurite resistance protein B-like protein [Microvirga subterranea]